MPPRVVVVGEDGDIVSETGSSVEQLHKSIQTIEFSSKAKGKGQPQKRRPVPGHKLSKLAAGFIQYLKRKRELDQLNSDAHYDPTSLQIEALEDENMLEISPPVIRSSVSEYDLFKPESSLSPIRFRRSDNSSNYHLITGSNFSCNEIEKPNSSLNSFEALNVTSIFDDVEKELENRKQAENFFSSSPVQSSTQISIGDLSPIQLGDTCSKREVRQEIDEETNETTIESKPCPDISMNTKDEQLIEALDTDFMTFSSGSEASLKSQTTDISLDEFICKRLDEVDLSEDKQTFSKAEQTDRIEVMKSQPLSSWTLSPQFTSMEVEISCKQKPKGKLLEDEQIDGNLQSAQASYLKTKESCAVNGKLQDSSSTIQEKTDKELGEVHPKKTIRKLSDLSSEDRAKVKSSEELCFALTFQGNFTNFRHSSFCVNEVLIPRSCTVRAMCRKKNIEFYRANLHHPEEVELLMEILTKAPSRKIAYDAKSFLKYIRGISKQCQIVQIPALKHIVILDPLVGCWLLQPDKPVKSFQDCVRELGVKSARVDYGNRNMICQDLHALSSIMENLFQRLHAENIWNVFYKTEMRLLPILVGMELDGVNIDTAELKRMQDLLSAEASEIEERCQTLSSRSFNISSSKQVREVLFDDLKLDKIAGVDVGRTPGGEKSTCEAVLKKLKPHHELPGLILRHRQLYRSQVAYIEGLLQHSVGGKVHTNWDQIGAATGRLTSVSPNLQAIPKKEIPLENFSVNMRKSFIASPGYLLVSADYEQIELRILAHLSGDLNLLRAIRADGDIFQELTGVWHEKPVSEVSSQEREKTKHVVYALMYGAGKIKLSEILDTTAEQAQGIISSFYEKFAQLKSFQRSVVRRAEQQGFLINMFGRKRCFPQINTSNFALKVQSHRQAFNFLIQGTAADIAKNSLIKTQGELLKKKFDSRVILLIHDEIVWEVQSVDREKAIDIITNGLQDHSSIFPKKVDFKIPLLVKVSVGRNLGDMKIF